MGQPLPLPQRIPAPDDYTCKLMIEKGFTIGDAIDIEHKSFVTYTMPEGWKFINNSWRQDLPQWEFVCPDGLVHFSVNGAWKGSYDNDITLSALMIPRKFDPVSQE